MSIEEKMEEIMESIAENERRIGYIKEENKRLRAAYTKLTKIAKQLREIDPTM